MSDNTKRFYSAAQAAFRSWCASHSIRFPASHHHIALYLSECFEQRGASTVPVQLAAIAQLYRNRGRPLDSKAPQIQAVVVAARDEIRRNKG